MSKSSRSRKKVASIEFDEPLSDSSSVISSREDTPRSTRAQSSQETEDVTHDPSDDLFAAIDNLTEKRATTREAGVQQLISILSHNFLPEAIEKNVETAGTALLNMVKRGSDSEAISALRGLGLVAFTAGLHSQSALRIAADARELLFDISLKQMSADESEKREVAEGDFASKKAGAILTWSYLEFLCSQSTGDYVTYVDPLFEAMGKVFAQAKRGQVPGSACAAACSGWGVCAASCPVSYIASSLFDKYRDVFVELLEHSDVDVRVAAGENLALLFQSKTFMNGGGASDEDEDEDEEGLADEDLIDRLETLSREQATFKSKKDVAKQKASFRDILATVQTGECKGETLQVKKQVLQFESWQKIMILDMLRTLFKGGLTTHIARNPCVRELLGVSGIDFSAEREKLTAAQKRSMRSPNSAYAKERTMFMSKTRSQQMEDHFYDDGF